MQGTQEVDPKSTKIGLPSNSINSCSIFLAAESELVAISDSSTVVALPLTTADELDGDLELDSCFVHVHNEELTRRKETKQTKEYTRNFRVIEASFLYAFKTM